MLDQGIPIEVAKGEFLVFRPEGEQFFYPTNYLINPLASRIPFGDLIERLERSDVVALDIGECVRDTPERTITRKNVRRKERWEDHPEWRDDALRKIGEIVADYLLFRRRWTLADIEDYSADYAESKILPKLSPEMVDLLLRDVNPLYPGVEEVIEKLSLNSDIIIISRGLEPTAQQAARELSIRRENVYSRRELKGGPLVEYAERVGAKNLTVFGDTWHEFEAVAYAQLQGYEVTGVQVQHPFEPRAMDGRMTACVQRGNWKGLNELLTYH
jgi:hypothetical protein